MYIFVYGSLKQGYWNHYLLEEDNVSYVGEATIKGFSLYHVATYPGMVKSNDLDEKVYGEIYNISLKVLKSLDNLEREGFLYKRISTVAEIASEEIDVSTYLYMFEVDKSLKVENNNWEGHHGKTKGYGSIKFR